MPGCELLSGARSLPAASFDDRAARAAAAILAAGLGPGDSVALLLRNDFAFLEATLGAQQAGCYPVPINWHLKGEEVRYILDDCQARLLVAHIDLLAAIEGHLPDDLTVLYVDTAPEIAAAYRIPSTPILPNPRHHEWNAWLAEHPPAPRGNATARESVIYTSGTTGRPKGVQRRIAEPWQSQRMEAARRATYGFRDGIRTILTAPMYHSAPNSYAVRAVRQGSLIVLMPRFDPEEFLQLVERHAITHLFLVPTMFIRLLKLPEAVRARYNLSSLQFIIHAGAPCPPEVKRAMIGWLGPIVNEFYGCTESGAVTFVDSDQALDRPGTVGRPVEGARIRIVAEDGATLPTGAIGEIFVGIDYYPDFTYIGRDDLRQEVGRDGLITGGDVGYLDEEGFLFICDRKRDMVIVGGVNVYPAEIESTLATMPGIRDSAVFGIPDPEYGEALMAVIQPLEAATVDLGQVRTWLTTRLAAYKIPRTMELRPDLPREDTGKIFKRRLRDPYWQGTGRTI